MPVKVHSSEGVSGPAGSGVKRGVSEESGRLPKRVCHHRSSHMALPVSAAISWDQVTVRSSPVCVMGDQSPLENAGRMAASPGRRPTRAEQQSGSIDCLRTCSVGGIFPVVLKTFVFFLKNMVL